jgi:hypothetical protein
LSLVSLPVCNPIPIHLYECPVSIWDRIKGGSCSLSGDVNRLLFSYELYSVGRTWLHIAE